MVTAVRRIGEIEHGRRIAGFAPVDLAQLVRETAEFFEPVAEDRGVALVVAVEAGMPAVAGDRDLLFEAMSNLVENAVKFTPTGGQVRIGLASTGSGTEVFVEDTGPGIPGDEREQVFRHFYRAERARQTPGHGLGLGLVAAIVKLHGFSVIVETAAGGGARFSIVCASDGPMRDRSHGSVAAALPERASTGGIALGEGV